MFTLTITRLNIVLSVIMALVGLLVPRILLSYYMRKRRRTFEFQFVQGLDFLSSSMKAGLSFVQALESLVENSVPPLSQEFDLLLREYRIGIPLNEALQNLARRVESEELNYNPNGDRIWSDSATTMIEPGRISEGLGFESDLNFRRTVVGPGSIRNTGGGGGTPN